MTTAVEFRVLGSLRVLDGEGSEILLASAAQRRMVGVLLVAAGDVISADALELRVGLSAGAVRTTISRLRRLLGQGVIATSAGGYELIARRVDAIDFESMLLGLGHGNDNELLNREAHTLAADTLRKALDLWRGDAFAGFAHEEWAMARARQLDELHSSAREALAAHLIALGDHSSAIAEMQTLVVAEPYRDRPRELIMTALACTGRRVEALRLFHEYRQILIDDVGTEPSESLVQLDQRIAAGLGAVPEHERVPRASGMHHSAELTRGAHQVGSTGLPSPTTSFVGRRVELDSLASLIAGSRLVTITGVGGCGKSRLALQYASDRLDVHPGGTSWVELSRTGTPLEDQPIGESSHVIAGCVRGGAEETEMQSATRATYPLMLSRVTEELAGSVGVSGLTEGSLDLVVAQLATAGPALVVLDNADHVLSSCSEVARELTERCTDLHVLVTSREPLGVTGETLYHLDPMESPNRAELSDPQELGEHDATSLFCARMSEARGQSVMNAHSARNVAMICARLDGLPLAMELAAARTRTMSLDWILAGIDSVLDESGSRSVDPVVHHRSLRASIEWSTDLLDPADRGVLYRLSVFNSPFTAVAATAVAGGDATVVAEMVRVLSRLADKSLLIFDSTSGRYRLLQTIREHGRHHLAEQGESELVATRHARWYAQWCTEVGDGLHGIDRGPVLGEMPDVVAAMNWARQFEPAVAMRISIGLGAIRSTLGHPSDVVFTWDWLRSVSYGERTEMWATAAAALMAAATAARLDPTEMLPEVERLLSDPDERARGWVVRGRSMVPAYHGHLDLILRHTESLISRRDDVEAAVYVGFAAYMSSLMGHLRQGLHLVDHLHQVTRRNCVDFCVDTVGNGFAAEVNLLGYRGDISGALQLGEAPVPRDPAFSMTAAAALAHFALMAGDRPALDSALRWSRRGTLPLLKFLIAEMELYELLARGDLAEAAHAADQFWEESAPVPVSRVHLSAIVVLVLLRSGRRARASALIDEAAALLDTMDDAPLLGATVELARAQLAGFDRRFEDLEHHGAATLEVAQQHGFELLVIDALELLAVAADAAGDLGRAVWLANSALTGRRRTGYCFDMDPPIAGAG